jgi:hypothetical protein
MDTFDNIIDRTGWPAGEWDKEPDRATWVHDETGACCTLRRGPMGHWCGYVGLRPNHPCAGKDYHDIGVRSEELTYGAYCHPTAEDEWISYRILRETWITESLVYPQGEAARMLREDRKGDTSTLIGFLEWIRLHELCHDDCPHGLWWLGFDCGHAFDISPRMLMHLRKRKFEFPSEGMFATTYKNFEYVVAATNALAAELFEDHVIEQKK